MKKKAEAKVVPPKRPRGRQSTFDAAKAALICERLSKGEPLAWICRDSGMPKVRTVSDWKTANEEFAADFARARDDGFDALAASCLEIANTPLEGIRMEVGDDGKTKEVREDMLGHRKLQIETRLKLLARWDPKRYGEKIQQEHSGEIGVRNLAERMRNRKAAK